MPSLRCRPSYSLPDIFESYARYDEGMDEKSSAL